MTCFSWVKSSPITQFGRGVGNTTHKPTQHVGLSLNLGRPPFGSLPEIVTSVCVAAGRVQILIPPDLLARRLLHAVHDVGLVVELSEEHEMRERVRHEGVHVAFRESAVEVGYQHALTHSRDKLNL